MPNYNEELDVCECGECDHCIEEHRKWVMEQEAKDWSKWAERINPVLEDGNGL